MFACNLNLLSLQSCECPTELLIQANAVMMDDVETPNETANGCTVTLNDCKVTCNDVKDADLLNAIGGLLLEV